MNFYLSSFKIGNQAERLKELVPNKKVFYINNALDSKSMKQESIERAKNNNFNELKELGIEAEHLDLKDYFGKEKELEEKLDQTKAVWINGGNTFILLQAMRLSGFDKYIKKNLNDPNFLYAGYSAAVCALATDLKSIQNVDDPHNFPYDQIKETSWEGLKILPYMILPHYKSDHPESPFSTCLTEYCLQNDVPFKTLSDGNVIIFQYPDYPPLMQSSRWLMRYPKVSRERFNIRRNRRCIKKLLMLGFLLLVGYLLWMWAIHDDDELDVADEAQNHLKIICWMHISKERMEYGEIIKKKGWGRECTEFLLLSDFEDRSRDVHDVSKYMRKHQRGQPFDEGCKIWYSWKYLHDRYYNHRDAIFLKVEPTTYMMMKNYKAFLSRFDINIPFYLGRAVRDKDDPQRQYIQGGPSITLNHATLRLMIQQHSLPQDAPNKIKECDDEHVKVIKDEDAASKRDIK